MTIEVQALKDQTAVTIATQNNAAALLQAAKDNAAAVVDVTSQLKTSTDALLAVMAPAPVPASAS